MYSFHFSSIWTRGSVSYQAAQTIFSFQCTYFSRNKERRNSSGDKEKSQKDVYRKNLAKKLQTKDVLTMDEMHSPYKSTVRLQIARRGASRSRVSKSRNVSRRSDFLK